MQMNNNHSYRWIVDKWTTIPMYKWTTMLLCKQTVNEQQCYTLMSICKWTTMWYDFKMSNITFQLQVIILLFKYELDITRQVNEISRNGRLLNEASKGNQTTHDL